MRDKTRLDDYDNHHRRIGEKDIKEEDIIEQEPNDIDKMTRPTTSTMTSSIMDHIICAISHFAIEKTWLAKRKWGVNTPMLDGDAFCTACNRWADGIRRRSRRHCKKIQYAGPRECDNPHDPADVPLQEALAATRYRAHDPTKHTGGAAVSLLSRAEWEAPPTPRRRSLVNESPPPGWAPARRDPDLTPVGALLAASLSEVPECDLAIEKAWLFEKQYKVDNVKNHRLSRGHVERINLHGDRNLYIRVKMEPKQHRSPRRDARPSLCPLPGGSRTLQFTITSECSRNKRADQVGHWPPQSVPS